MLAANDDYHLSASSSDCENDSTNGVELAPQKDNLKERLESISTTGYTSNTDKVPDDSLSETSQPCGEDSTFDQADEYALEPEPEVWINAEAPSVGEAEPAGEADNEAGNADEAIMTANSDEADKADEPEVDEANSDYEKMYAFLAVEKFECVNARRDVARRLRRFDFPLHAAVKRNDAEIVRLLLAAGAYTFLQDSQDQTPLNLAQKLNREGSHDAVLLAFGCVPPCTTMPSCDDADATADDVNTTTA